MSYPNQTFRWAGIWNVTQRFVYADVVIDELDEKCYVNVNITGPTIGGPAPSSVTDNWLLMPSSGGAVNSVTTGMGSGMATDPSTGDVIIVSNLTAGGGIDLEPGAGTELTISLTSGIFIQPIVFPSVSTAVISIPGLTISGVVLLTYVHASGGGGAQYFKSSIPTADTLTVLCNTALDPDDQIIWFVAKL
jgi:hypothetical protein